MYLNRIQTFDNDNMFMSIRKRVFFAGPFSLDQSSNVGVMPGCSLLETIIRKHH